MEGSPFNRSALTRRSPPSTPTCCSPPPAAATRSPERKSGHQEDQPLELLSTPEIQNWMTSIEQCLHDVCTISSEGKLNTEQKLRIQNLCRKVGHGTSQMAVQYQSLKQKAILAHSTIKVLMEKNELAQQIHHLNQSIQESSLNLKIEEPSIPKTRTFADMVKKSAQNYIEPKKINCVAIYPTDKMKSSEETKTLVQKIIRPEEMKLHVRSLRNTKNGGVIISTDNKADIEKLKLSTTLTTSGFIVDEPTKRKPRIVVIGVPSSMQASDVLNYIYNQNLVETLQKMTLEQFLASIKISHKSGKKDAETCNYVIEVTAQIRKALITKDRLFINWSSCPIRDFTVVTRCYRCQQYGHAAKTCRAEANTCGHCGELGHAMRDCTKKTESPKCATCMHFKKPSNHKTGDNNCPAKIIAEQRYINSVDYDAP